MQRELPYHKYGTNLPYRQGKSAIEQERVLASNLPEQLYLMFTFEPGNLGMRTVGYWPVTYVLNRLVVASTTSLTLFPTLNGLLSDGLDVCVLRVRQKHE